MEVGYQLIFTDYQEANRANRTRISSGRCILIGLAFVALVGCVVWELRMPQGFRLWPRALRRIAPAELIRPLFLFAPWTLVAVISSALVNSRSTSLHRKFDVLHGRDRFGFVRSWIVLCSAAIAAMPILITQMEQLNARSIFANPTPINLGVIFFFVWSIFVLILRLYLIPKHRRRVWQLQPALARPRTMEYSAEYVTVTEDLSSSTHKWAAFVRCVDTTNLFMLYPSGVSFIIIPKRAFPSVEAINDFRQLIQDWANGQSMGFPVISRSSSSNG